MSHPFPALFAALDLVVFERQPDAAFRQVTPSPAWLGHAAGEGSILESAAVMRLFPFLESFLGDAEVAWRDPGSPPVRSEAFSAVFGDDDLLLRAAAVTAEGTPMLIFERLTGAVDPRPVLQSAREGALLRERLTRVLESLRAPAESLAGAIAELQDAAPGVPAHVLDVLKAVGSRIEKASRGEVPSGPGVKR